MRRLLSLVIPVTLAVGCGDQSFTAEPLVGPVVSATAAPGPTMGAGAPAAAVASEDTDTPLTVGISAAVGTNAALAGARAFFDPVKGAWRAGQVTGTDWDPAYVGLTSVAMGQNTSASGVASTALGGFTSASGDFSTAMGKETIARGLNSTALGLLSSASGEHSLAAGHRVIASGFASIALGNQVTANANAATAMGFDATASGRFSLAVGRSTTASADYSTALGHRTISSGGMSTATGETTTASGLWSTATGFITSASGRASTTMGDHTSAQAYASLVLGRYNVIGGTTDSWVESDPVFVIGNGTTVSNRNNAFEVLKNGNTTVDGDVTISGSLEAGTGTATFGTASAALGTQSRATGNASAAFGAFTTSEAFASVALGRFNEIAGNKTTWVATDPVFVIGNGTDFGNRNNAFEVLKNGNTTVDGDFTVTGSCTGCASDARLKQHVRPLADALASINQLTGVTYEWRDDVREAEVYPGPQVGVLGHEVARVFPELVGTDSRGFQYVRYQKLVAPLIEAVKELTARHEALQAEKDAQIAELTRRLSELERALVSGTTPIKRASE